MTTDPTPLYRLRDGVGPDDPMFTTVRGRRINPDVLSQTFARVVLCSGVRRIRFRQTRHQRGPPRSFGKGL